MVHDRTRTPQVKQKGDKRLVRYDLQPPLTIINAPIGSVPTGVQSFATSLNLYMCEPIEGALVPYRFHAFALTQAIEIPPHFRYVGADGSVVSNDYFHVFWEATPEDGAQ
jgi:hypothetical protein